MAVKNETLLDVSTRILLANPSASLGEVAVAAGISRTTLHSRYPTRETLLVAMAHEAMDMVERVYSASGLAGSESIDVVFGRLVEGLLPMGARIELLLRERSLDSDEAVNERYDGLDRPLIDFIAGAQSRGQIVSDVPAWWVASALLGTIYTAWEAVTDGRLAPRDAPALVLRTVVDGVRRR
jgi:AcrR family transcriptional regulator